MIDVQSLVKYLLEGLAVAAAAYYIPRRTADLKEIAMIAITAASVFAVLDMFAPAVSSGARQGAGFGIGYNITNGLEGFDSEEEEDNDVDDIEEESDDSSEEETTEDESENEDQTDDDAPCDQSGINETFASVM